MGTLQFKGEVGVVGIVSLFFHGVATGRGEDESVYAGSLDVE